MGGEVLRCGRRTAKGVTGYDLVAGFVGSEGTLGVITELVLKLLPKPPAARHRARRCSPTSTAAGAAITRAAPPRASARACSSSPTGPRSMHVAARAAYRFPDGAGAIVLIEVDGEHDGLDAAIERDRPVAATSSARSTCSWRPSRPIGARCGRRAAADLAVAARRHTASRSTRTSACRAARIVEMLARVDAHRRGDRHPTARSSATPATATCTSTSCSTTTRTIRRCAPGCDAAARAPVRAHDRARRHAVGRARHRPRPSATTCPSSSRPPSSSGSGA